MMYRTFPMNFEVFQVYILRVENLVLNILSSNSTLAHRIGVLKQAAVKRIHSEVKETWDAR